MGDDDHIAWFHASIHRNIHCLGIGARSLPHHHPCFRRRRPVPLGRLRPDIDASTSRKSCYIGGYMGFKPVSVRELKNQTSRVLQRVENRRTNHCGQKRGKPVRVIECRRFSSLRQFLEPSRFLAAFSDKSKPATRLCIRNLSRTLRRDESSKRISRKITRTDTSCKTWRNGSGSEGRSVWSFSIAIFALIVDRLFTAPRPFPLLTGVSGGAAQNRRRFR